MSRIGLSLSLVAVLVGLAIFGITLFVASQVSSSGGSMTSRRLYFGREILPDHVLYPLVVGADRLRMEMVPPEERAVMQLSLAERSFEYARELMAGGQQEMAASTFLESQQHLFSALEAIDEVENSDEISGALRARLQIQTYMLEQYRNDFMEDRRQQIDGLISKSIEVLENL